MGEQDLRGLHLMLGETGFPGLHQPHLPYRRSCLQLVDGRRALRPAEPTHTGRHCARGHQHQLDARPVQGHHLLDPAGHGPAIQTATVVGQQGTADFHHPALGARHLIDRKSVV